jgi:DmsE family decaheme c-type cytochrome
MGSSQTDAVARQTSSARYLAICAALVLVAALAVSESPAPAEVVAKPEFTTTFAALTRSEGANGQWHQIHDDEFKQAAYFHATGNEGESVSPHAAVLPKKKAKRTTAKRSRTAAAETSPKPKDETVDKPASNEKKKDEKEEPKHEAVTGPATYVGSAKCMSCHVSQGETFSKTTMGRIFLKNPRSEHEKLGCEACHGPGSIHVATGGKEDEGGESIFTFDADSPRSIPDRNARCLTCHESGMRTHWKGSQHETRGLACTSCHQIMDKTSPRNQLIKATEVETCTQCHKDRKAQLWRSSHMPVREGKLTCTSCHNPHGTPNQKLLKEATVNETCYTCHADKRGPFLFEHAPARDNCLNCHEPHGSIHEKLLTVSRPRLCQQCHSEEDHPSEPHGPRELFAFNRGCANCHGGMQHGSNSPSGAQLHR